jgi:hypothetical protein
MSQATLYPGIVGGNPGGLGSTTAPLLGGTTNLGTQQDQAIFGGASNPGWAIGNGFISDVARPWQSSGLSGMTYSGVTGDQGLNAPYTTGEDDTSERRSNVQLSVERTLHKPAELETLNGVYPPGGITYIRREEETRTTYSGRNFAPSLVPVGYEEHTLPMINLHLAQRALTEGRPTPATKYNVEYMCGMFAIDGVIQGQPAGDAGMPDGRYVQGNQTISADVVSAGPLKLWDIWHARSRGACNGTKLFLIMKMVQLPTIRDQFRYVLHPRGSPGIVDTGALLAELATARVTHILQVVPYMASLRSGDAFGFPPLCKRLYRDAGGILQQGAVFSIGRILDASNRVGRSVGTDGANPDWPDACVRELPMMLKLPQIDVLLDVRRCLYPL